jgi:hypothetical protein
MFDLNVYEIGNNNKGRISSKLGQIGDPRAGLHHINSPYILGGIYFVSDNWSLWSFLCK